MRTFVHAYVRTYMPTYVLRDRMPLPSESAWQSLAVILSDTHGYGSASTFKQISSDVVFDRVVPRGSRWIEAGFRSAPSRSWATALEAFASGAQWRGKERPRRPTRVRDPARLWWVPPPAHGGPPRGGAGRRSWPRGLGGSPPARRRRVRLALHGRDQGCA